MSSRQKGMGATVNNSIMLPQRVALVKWCMGHADDRRTFAELSADATKELGFVVTMNCMQNHWTATNGRRHTHKERENGGTLAAKIAALAVRVSDCEARLTAAGA